MSFSTLVLMFALTWRKRKRERQKDLERVIKKKRNRISLGEKHDNFIAALP